MIKERIIQLIEYKNIAKEIFYKKIGMTSANFRGKAKETPINSNAIENILSEIPDVNLQWLLTGKGEMLKKDLHNTFDNIVSEQPANYIPLIPIEAMAGKGNGAVQILQKDI